MNEKTVKSVIARSGWPDWLNNMSEKQQKNYFEKNPNSKYNPNRKKKAVDNKNDIKKSGSNSKAIVLPKEAKLKENSKERQKQIYKLMADSKDVRKNSAKQVKKDLVKFKQENPEKYAETAAKVKALLEDDKPGGLYRVSQFFGRYLASAGFGFMGNNLTAAIAMGTATPIAPYLVIPMYTAATYFAFTSFARLFGFGGKFKEHKKREKRNIRDLLETSSIKDIPAEELFDKLCDGFVKFVANIDNDVIAKYGKVVKGKNKKVESKVLKAISSYNNN